MRRAAAVLSTLVLALPACRAREELTVIGEAQLPEVYASPRPVPSVSPVRDFPKTGSVHFVQDGLLRIVETPLPPAPALAQALLVALLQGVPEEAFRVRTHVPEDTRLLDLGVVGDIATVDLSQEFRGGARGRSLALRVAQVVYTLTEDPQIRSVIFTIEGVQTGVVADSGRVLDRPVDRRDFAQFV